MLSTKHEAVLHESDTCTFNVDALEACIIVSGHYGTGKTNFSLNLAYDLKRAGRNVCLIDLDIVNPYFRSSEYSRVLEEEDIQVVSPVLANSTLDTPSLSGHIDALLQEAFCASLSETDKAADTKTTTTLLFDLGGDPEGSRTLARYASEVAKLPYDFIYLINKYREEVNTAEKAYANLQEIEAVTHLQATAFVNNSHLQSETTHKTVADTLEYAHKFAQVSSLECIATTVQESCVQEVHQALHDMQPLYIIKRRVLTPWEVA